MRAVALTGAFSNSPDLRLGLPAFAEARCCGLIFCLISRSSVRGEEKWIFGRAAAGHVDTNRSSVSRISSRSGFRHQKCW